MNLFAEIKQRWVAESPALFVKLTNLSVTVGGSATAVWLANSGMHLDLPDVILSVCKYAIAACAACGLTSKITVK